MLTVAFSYEQACCQTFSEWFRQKSTQRKYLLQQISALMAYQQYAAKGYAIAKGGLGSIGDYAGREFQLHRNYYNSLRTVSAPVKDEPRVKAIIRRQQDILNKTSGIKKQPGLSMEEHAYLDRVCAALLRDCDGQLHDLEVLLKDNDAEMSDEERLRQITRIHQAMQENYRFAASFSAEVKLFATGRRQQLQDIQLTKRFYGNL
ncbi:hypothetical protein BC343_19560 [Mucilaginibacter pedocola]|uniref:Uncharacterized protein n=1 Tax=Mucilaginibacter pedocola TaxID=1792845 RepID=A0A1S9P6V2_9SPHI|nr:hypothetical protein BC343_19560 [Mucilaginibacter pedocola]